MRSIASRSAWALSSRLACLLALALCAAWGTAAPLAAALPEKVYLTVDEALARGLKEKSDEFARTGGALYS